MRRSSLSSSHTLPRALTPKGSTGTPKLATPKCSPGAAQHPPHMFLLGCYDTSPRCPMWELGPLEPPQGWALLVPSNPRGQTPKSGMGHPVPQPACQPQPSVGCQWQQPREVTAGTNLHGAPTHCQPGECGAAAGNGSTGG